MLNQQKEDNKNETMAAAIMTIIVAIFTFSTVFDNLARDYRLLFQPTEYRLGAITASEVYGGEGNMKYTYRFLVNTAEYIKTDTVEYRPEGAYQVGDSVWVRYNVKNPGYSTLRSLDWIRMLFFMLSAVWIGALVSVIYLVIRFRKWLRQKKQTHKAT